MCLFLVLCFHTYKYLILSDLHILLFCLWINFHTLLIYLFIVWHYLISLSVKFHVVLVVNELSSKALNYHVDYTGFLIPYAYSLQYKAQNSLKLML